MCMLLVSLGLETTLINLLEILSFLINFIGLNKFGEIDK